MEHQTHLNWIVGLIIITLLVCGTVIYLNNNSWTVRLEMDNNTKEAIESIGWEELSEVGKDEVWTCPMLLETGTYVMQRGMVISPTGKEIICKRINNLEWGEQ